jgi:hypothetical protein
MYCVLLAIGHVRLVAMGSTLVELVVAEDKDTVTEDDAVGVTVTVGVEVERIVRVMVELGLGVVDREDDIVLLVSGHVAPGSHGLMEQHPLNPFWQT